MGRVYGAGGMLVCAVGGPANGGGWRVQPLFSSFFRVSSTSRRLSYWELLLAHNDQDKKNSCTIVSTIHRINELGLTYLRKDGQSVDHSSANTPSVPAEGLTSLGLPGATDGVVTAKSEVLGSWAPRTCGAARDREGHGGWARGNDSEGYGESDSDGARVGLKKWMATMAARWSGRARWWRRG